MGVRQVHNALEEHTIIQESNNEFKGLIAAIEVEWYWRIEEGNVEKMTLRFGISTTLHLTKEEDASLGAVRALGAVRR